MLDTPDQPRTAHAPRVDTYADVAVLVHVGPHKTGTSWLQESLLKNAGGVVYEQSFEPSFRAFLEPAYHDFSDRAARDVYVPLLDRARVEKKPLVISDEALGGRSFGKRFVREVLAQRIQKVFPHARILMTTREQDAVILSMYGEYLRYGFSSSLKAFLTQETGRQAIHPLLDLSYYEWDRALDFYESVFSPEQVLAIPMEWGLAEEGNYPSALEQFVGAPLGLPEELNVASVERSSLSGWALGFLRRANKFVPSDTRYLQRSKLLKPVSLAHYVDRWTPASARRASKDRMRATVRAMIGDRYAASNQAFQSATDINLKALGYRMG